MPALQREAADRLSEARHAAQVAATERNRAEAARECAEDHERCAARERREAAWEREEAQRLRLEYDRLLRELSAQPGKPPFKRFKAPEPR